MGKLHTRAKRKLGLTTSFRHNSPKNLVKKHGPRTFKTEESAHKWAVKNKLEKGKYSLVSVKKRKKFKISYKILKFSVSKDRKDGTRRRSNCLII